MPWMEVAQGHTVALNENQLCAGLILPSLVHQSCNKFSFQIGKDEAGEGEASSHSSSSIGSESSSGDDDRDEAESKINDGALGSLEAIEESLPIKRGLSNFFTGKSRSFQSLAEVATARVEDVAKPENPFNKRRRLLMACKNSWSKRAKSYSSLLPPLPPLTAEGDEDEDDEDDDRGAVSGGRPPRFPDLHERKEEREVKREFRSARSFSLTDLQRV